MNNAIYDLFQTSLGNEFLKKMDATNWHAIEMMLDAEPAFSGQKTHRVLMWAALVVRSDASKNCLKKLINKFQPNETDNANTFYDYGDISIGTGPEVYSLLHGIIQNKNLTFEEAKEFIGLLLDKGADPTLKYRHYASAINYAYERGNHALFNYMLEKIKGKNAGDSARELIQIYDKHRKSLPTAERARLEREIAEYGLLALGGYLAVNTEKGKENTAKHARKQADFARIVEQCRDNTLPSEAEFARQSRALSGWVSSEYANIRNLVYKAVLSDPEKCEKAYEDYLKATVDDKISLRFTASKEVAPAPAPVTASTAKISTIAAPVAQSSSAVGSVAALCKQFESLGNNNRKSYGRR